MRPSGQPVRCDGRWLMTSQSPSLHSRRTQLAWAPGKGVKGKEWKDYWEVELGVSYIPWDKMSQEPDLLDILEEGGMIDEETVPGYLRFHPTEIRTSVSPSSAVEQLNTTNALANYATEATQTQLRHSSANSPVIPAEPLHSNKMSGPPPGFIPLPDGHPGPPPPTSVAQQVLDTSQPPPLHPADAMAGPPGIPGLPGRPGPMQMVSPFAIPNVPPPMGMAMGPGGMMHNVPIGVPPPGMQGILMHQQMLGGVPQPVNSPFNPANEAPPSTLIIEALSVHLWAVARL
uniref:Uncharacterized protein n=1 Tax=Timema douglasi TaxID=61478 RepID=A0A7R8VH02_TIMDO|nr:unnamed protein product [Timema douglasi]